MAVTKMKYNNEWESAKKDIKAIDEIILFNALKALAGEI